MTSREHLIIELLSDPTCKTMMFRDGVRAQDVLNLMRSVKPLVLRESSYRRQQERLSRLAA